MQNVLVRAQGLQKSFGPVEVLRGVSFEIQAGEKVGVVGPSGAGKSTLLHLLGLLTPPSRGRLELAGREVGSLNDKEATRLRSSTIGFLFQSHHLLPDLSLLENVMIPLFLRRLPTEEAHVRARGLLTRLGLGHRLHHRPGETSGGEQQRTALARAMVAEPALLLADEPTGNLDRGIGREVESTIREITEAHGTTLVLVTHDEHLASHMDRRLLIVDGRLEKIDCRPAARGRPPPRGEPAALGVTGWGPLAAR
ncbi:MAG: ABC transporter ATP-binding protein [Elusimicrobia bacterium]|nr:ABC transporter ATP-binding protein [Elusimicrobiota bacterium]